MTRHHVNGTDLYVESSGSGDPLVLVHGGWTDHTSWRFVVPGLAERHRVVTYDRRGHSRSDRHEGATPRRIEEDDLAALIEALDLGPVGLAANSYGASIALGLAARRPDLVRAVMAHEPPLLGVAVDDPALGRRLAPLTTLLHAVGDGIRAGRYEDSAARFMEEGVLGRGAWAAIPEESRRMFASNAPTFAAMLDDPHWARLPASPSTLVRVLLTEGDASPWWLPAIVQALAAGRYPDATRHTFAGAGHVPHLTHVDEYVGVVTAFLAGALESVIPGSS